MSTDIYWPALVRDAYAMAREKGWHDPEPSVGEYIALMHSEVSEALEAYRKVGDFGVYMKSGWSCLSGDIWSRIETLAVNDWLVYELTDEPDEPFFPKPEGVPIELSDLVIRIADFCGAHTQEGSGHFALDAPIPIDEDRDAWLVWDETDQSFGGQMYCLHQALAGPCGPEEALTSGLYMAQDFCERHGIDLAAAIRLKMAYNATRPMRHGGKVL